MTLATFLFPNIDVFPHFFELYSQDTGYRHNTFLSLIWIIDIFSFMFLSPDNQKNDKLTPLVLAFEKSLW